MPSRRVTVYVAEDHPLFRKALVAAIKRRPDLEHTGSAATGREALEAIRAEAPDVLVLDMRLPDLDGQSVLNAITRDGLGTKVLVVSGHIEGNVVYDALAAGAS